MAFVDLRARIRDRTIAQVDMGDKVSFEFTVVGVDGTISPNKRQ